MKITFCLLIIASLLFGSAAFGNDKYNEFWNVVKADFKVYGRPEIFVESGSKIIMLFKAGDKFKRLEMDKATGKYKISMERRYETVQETKTD
jgi:hypothetical protein